MANVLITPAMFTKMTLMNLGGYLNICANMSHDYTSQFGNKAQKIGDTLSVRRPQRFLVTDGMGYQPQPITNTQVPITVNQVKGVHFQWDEVERTLSLTEIDELYSKPAALALASVINNQAATYIAQNTFNLVGTPGTTPTSMLTYLAAADKIIGLGLPEGEMLNMVISRRMSSTYANAVSTLFNPGGTIGGQYKNGYIDQNQLGYKWKFDQTLWRQTYGTYSGTPLVNGANQTAEGGNNATMTLVTDGWGSGVSGLNAGDVFTIGGVYSTHPQTHQALSDLQQFTVTATITDTTGAMSPVIFPAITPSGQYQNVNAAAADNAVITVAGATGAVSEQGICMHKNAFAFLSVPMQGPTKNGVEEVAQEQDPDTGLNLMFTRYWDGDTLTHKNRFDTLFGFGRLYAEMACRVASA